VGRAERSEPRLDLAGPGHDLSPAAAAPRGLDAFFAPRGVAVVGASRTPGKVGHAVVRNLLYGGTADDRSAGFQGRIVPVNPQADEVLGVPAIPSVDRLKGEIDLAVFAIPAPEVPRTLDAAARRGVRAAIVLSAGFFELGDEGRRLGERLRSVARNNTQLRLIGPNCTGLYSARASLQASFFSVAPHEGPTSLISQSGALAQAMVQHSRTQGIGLRNAVSLGDKVDVDDRELLRYFARDEETGVIGLYVESIDDARRFHKAARRAAARKPVVVLRGGYTGAGHRAARLYEGALAVGDSSMESALHAPGVHRVPTLGDFLAAIRALATQPPAAGRRVAIVTNAGGAGVLAADSVADAGLDVVKLRPETLDRLGRLTENPRSWTNPVDLLADARADRFVAALDVVSRAAEVDAVLLVLTDQAMTDPPAVFGQLCEHAKGLAKPVVACFVGQPTLQSQQWRHGIPDYVLPENAVAGLKALVARGAFERRQARAPQRARRRSTRLLRHHWWH